MNQVIQMLAARSLSADYIRKKIPLADRILKSFERKGWIAVEEVSHDRDPLRAPSAKLRIALTGAEPQGKIPKAERELLAYLALHPGSHNVGDLDALVHNASQAARSLARKQAVTLTTEPITIRSSPVRAPHELNTSQRNAFDLIGAGIATRKFPRAGCPGPGPPGRPAFRPGRAPRGRLRPGPFREAR